MSLPLSQPVPPPGAWQVAGEPVQIWPAGHCELVVQEEPLWFWTVTENVTDAPPADDCAEMSHGPPVPLVKRYACASPPEPVGELVVPVFPVQ